MKKTLQVTSVDVLKAGQTKTGKPYTLYKVQVADPIGSFTTFTNHTTKVGQTSEFDLEERVNGQYKNWSELSRTASVTDQKIKDLEERVAKLEKLAVAKAPATAGDDFIPVINDADIDF